MRQMIRQGDVLLVPISEIPKRDNRKPERATGGRIVLARGEATGHHHSVPKGAATLVRSIDEEWAYLQVHEPVELEHQEHAPIQLSPGDYEVRRQREYSPAEIRNVLD